MSQSNAEIFLDKYRNLEYIIHNKYSLENWDSAFTYLSNLSEFRPIVNEIRYCREVRNLLTHKPKLKEEYCVEPSTEMIALLDHINMILEKPPMIMDIAVPASKVLSKHYTDNVVETLQEMNERSFGNVPIIENGIVKGVLSEKAMLHYIVREKLFHIADDLKLEDIRQYLLMENHEKERYCFVKKNAPISEVSSLFHDALDRGLRIGMVFITKNGRRDENLLGIVTAWDLAGNK